MIIPNLVIHLVQIINQFTSPLLFTYIAPFERQAPLALAVPSPNRRERKREDAKNTQLLRKVNTTHIPRRFLAYKRRIIYGIVYADTRIYFVIYSIYTYTYIHTHRKVARCLYDTHVLGARVKMRNPDVWCCCEYFSFFLFFIFRSSSPSHQMGRLRRVPTPETCECRRRRMCAYLFILCEFICAIAYICVRRTRARVRNFICSAGRARAQRQPTHSRSRYLDVARRYAVRGMI